MRRVRHLGGGPVHWLPRVEEDLQRDLYVGCPLSVSRPATQKTSRETTISGVLKWLFETPFAFFQNVANLAYASGDGDDPCARVMLADRKDGSMIFAGKNMVRTLDELFLSPHRQFCCEIDKHSGNV
jgi:hypothetical protein